jgi:hypothetical protein
MLVFRLPHRGRVVLELLGPVPSCGVVAKAHVRARAGVNRINLDRRLHPGRLEPGVYRLAIRIAAGRVQGEQRLALRVDRRHRLHRGPSRPSLLALNSCSAGSGSTERPRPSALAVETAPAVVAKSHAGATHDGTTGSGKPQTGQSQKRSGVASASTQKRNRSDGHRSAIPRIAKGVSGLPKPVGFLLLAALVLILGGMSVMLVRFLRGSWNP